MCNQKLISTKIWRCLIVASRSSIGVSDIIYDVECIPKTIRNLHNAVYFYRLGTQIQTPFDMYVPYIINITYYYYTLKLIINTTIIVTIIILRLNAVIIIFFIFNT